MASCVKNTHTESEKCDMSYLCIHMYSFFFLMLVIAPLRLLKSNVFSYTFLTTEGPLAVFKQVGLYSIVTTLIVILYTI